MIGGFFRRRQRERLKRGATVRVLMVCRANYCRSPMAEGVFGWRLEAAGLSDQVFVDSAGLHGQMRGNIPDPRGRHVAAAKGIDLSAIRARGLDPEDLNEFEYILAMDHGIHAALIEKCRTPQARARVGLLMQYRGATPSSVESAEGIPDPYYSGPAGFDIVLAQIDAGAAGLLRHIRSKHRI